MQIANHDNKKKLERREKRECKTFIIGILLSSPLLLLTYLKWYVSLTDNSQPTANRQTDWLTDWLAG